MSETLREGVERRLHQLSPIVRSWERGAEPRLVRPTRKDAEAIRDVLNDLTALLAAGAPTPDERTPDALREHVRLLAELGVREQWPPDEWRAALLAATSAPPAPPFSD